MYTKAHMRPKKETPQKKNPRESRHLAATTINIRRKGEEKIVDRVYNRNKTVNLINI